MGDSVADEFASRRHRTPTLHTRRPGYPVLRECLWIQAGAKPRGRVARVLGVSPLLREAKNWYRGGLGELEVISVLDVLGAEWTVLHSIPVAATGSGRATMIDHLVIGPGGVFAINAKNHAGSRIWVNDRTFLVDGRNKDHLHAALREMTRASRLLSEAVGARVDVTPVVVVANPQSITLGVATPLVHVLSSSGLYRFLHRRRVLSPADIARLSAAAADFSTWRSEPEDLPDTAYVVERFRALSAEVADARARSLTWSCGGLAAAFLPAVAVVATTVAPIWSAL